MRAKYPLQTALKLQALHRELNAQMKIRITEPVFFLGQDRKAGEVLDVEAGPFRNRVIAGGLELIPQFVEMAEEIKTIVQDAAQGVLPAQIPGTAAQNGSFAEATASVLKPAAAPTPISRTAALLSGLAGRRRQLEKTIVVEAAAYAKQLDDVESNVPEVFSKARASLEDRKASLGEIDDSLKEFAGANDPLQG